MMSEIKDILQKKNIMLSVFFLMGVFSTMPIIGIHFGNRDISMYKIFFFISIFYGLYRMIRDRKIMIGKKSGVLLAWLGVACIGGLCGWIFLRGSESAFSSSAFSWLTKAVVLIAFLLAWMGVKTRTEASDMVSDGFLTGCVFNCIWGVIDMISFYVFNKIEGYNGMILNNIIFAGFIERNGIARRLSLWVPGSNTYRVAGFNGDPANLGFIAPILVGYAITKRKYWLFIPAVGALFVSASTTGLVTSAFIILINLPFMLKKYPVKRFLIAVLALVITGGVFIFFASRELIPGSVDDTFNYFIERIITVYMNPDNLDIRVYYVLFAARAFIAIFPFVFFGVGIGNASLGYGRMGVTVEQFNKEDFAIPFDMENTYLAYLMDTGIIGFILFMAVLVILFRYYRKNVNSDPDTPVNSVMWAFICSTVVCLLFYHYILYAPMMMMLTIGLAQIDFKENTTVNLVDVLLRRNKK